MPTAAEFIAQPKPVRVFAFGADHVQKTLWSLQAAEAGFRVILFNFDNGAAIINMVAPAALDRIFIVDCFDGVTDAYASRVAVHALRSYDFWIDEESRQVSLHSRPGFKHIDMRNFGADTLVVFDSYTALATSFVRDFAFTHKIDLADAAKQEWPGYGWCGRSLNWLLTQIKAAPFNTITIGHKTTYDKMEKGKDGKPTGNIEFTKDIPVSSSHPHAMTIGRNWNEFLTFTKKGKQVYISTEGDDEASGGSRILPPQIYKYQELPFAALADVYGVKLQQVAQPFEFELGQELIRKPVTRILKQATTENKPVISSAQNTNPLINKVSGA